ncbi:ABC transporter ATP-binding protein [Corticicoccus populi]|uniref:ABC transporter ATP-binding protein n=1 Tax=Corticicoccus populi TaxID=1812821 RepID=A0ABW5WZT1_9STAP
MNRLIGEAVQVQYGDRVIIKNMDIEIPDKKITSVIGPNGCGKSTLIKALSRLHPVSSGKITLDGKNIHDIPSKEIARKIAVLPQSPVVSDGLTAGELVSYGRYPYQKGMGSLSKEDKKIISWAMTVTGIEDFKYRTINDLSGGQKQRVWIAMALAQKTDIIFLDEPTTFLDISHQLEILELVTELNRLHGVTVVMVLHDINQAVRFSDYIATMKDGELVATGKVDDILNKALLHDVFKIDAVLSTDEVTGKPFILNYQLAERQYISSSKVSELNDYE